MRRRKGGRNEYIEERHERTKEQKKGRKENETKGTKVGEGRIVY